jgi:hypothetical protein
MGVPILGSGGVPADQGGEYVEVRDNGPKIRLLYCYNCKTIEELPDFEGNIKVPGYLTLVSYLELV